MGEKLTRPEMRRRALEIAREADQQRAQAIYDDAMRERCADPAPTTGAAELPEEIEKAMQEAFGVVAVNGAATWLAAAMLRPVIRRHLAATPPAPAEAMPDRTPERKAFVAGWLWAIYEFRAERTVDEAAEEYITNGHVRPCPRDFPLLRDGSGA